MTAFRVLSGREASIFACLADTVVAPEGRLPPVRLTDAAVAFDEMLAAGPPLNRAALRAALLVLEIAPLALGFGRRLRRLDAERRAAFATRAAANPVLAPAFEALTGMAHLAYYGDAGVSRALGYDPRPAAA